MSPDHPFSPRAVAEALIGATVAVTLGLGIALALAIIFIWWPT